ncbi:TPA: NADH:flavorubredoxin reductase NorW [Enterobacter asburiae]|uniref:NADH:flavorubredoxin reductase NorW n=1 Tax=Enterobacter cloacae complex TaxID=354276 RepID=UPI0007557054|nr:MULTISPECIES: NADH:flavorubredoxin reductase NorW [Enterobacter cloacae complex]SAF87665.1 Nitric oxide reductase FlRd-NAD(+) reductase [Enterobacter cloacae]ASD60533.1 NADH:flavorubredoxin oxidoreductase [Enterobacter cloacae complex sp. ECNIH7]KVJ76673.1 NADH:flavorubredoxin oxidoreductase [Enterobacter asburiae]KZP91958.1 NADH:flavorubredoxin oxidoreductase [Enterobacter asburiae]MBJ3797437.1 NADH:flavorubredoxin reductase NorW [Enterobacter asburiae]
MNNGIVIIGSGFAARQLVKNIRKQDASVPLTVIAADSMDEYNKPDLSHVISQNQRAEDLTRQTAAEFAEQFNLRLFPYTWVTDIDAAAHVVKAKEKTWQYDKLVLATGASAFVPPVEGRELTITLNSQQEYQASETALRDAQRVMIVGGGLIGTELAMDFCRAGKSVTLVDHAASILSSLMPVEVSSRLQHRLTDMGVHLMLKSQLQSLSKTEGGIRATLDRSRSVEVDVVIAATGLRPETALAHRAGAEIQCGVKVNSYLQTTQPDIYALGDCAEINGQVLPFLQPIQLSAMYLAKNLLGGSAPLKLPAMLIKVKTPELPLHLAGETQRQDLNWQITLEPQGMVARGADNEGQIRAFVVSEDRMKEAFALLKLLPA